MQPAGEPALEMDPAMASEGQQLEELDGDTLNALLDMEFGDLEDLGDADADAEAVAGQQEGMEQLQEGMEQQQEGMEQGEGTPVPEALDAGQPIEPAPAEGEAGEQRYEDDMEGDELGDDGGGEAAGDGAAGEEAEAGAGPSARDEQEALRNQRIIASMTEAQLDRYESYRRSALPRSKMKKLLQQLLGTVLIDRALIAMCGIGKMFVGDLVELARHIAAGEGHTGPLLPRHVQRAYQVLDAGERIPHAPGTKKRMFR